jgi:excisionase family DNA binding protein
MEKTTNVPMCPTMHALLTRSELAEILRVSGRTIVRLVATKELPTPIRVGQRYRWRMEDVTGSSMNNVPVMRLGVGPAGLSPG